MMRLKLIIITEPSLQGELKCYFSPLVAFRIKNQMFIQNVETGTTVQQIPVSDSENYRAWKVKMDLGIVKHKGMSNTECFSWCGVITSVLFRYGTFKQVLESLKFHQISILIQNFFWHHLNRKRNYANICDWRCLRFCIRCLQFSLWYISQPELGNIFSVDRYFSEIQFPQKIQVKDWCIYIGTAPFGKCISQQIQLWQQVSRDL